MHEISCDVAVIGAGPAGLSAACAAKKHGADRVLLIERDTAPGGILQQCIHAGFGLSYFNEELTGPEYAGRFIQKACKSGVSLMLDTIVLEVAAAGLILASNPTNGIVRIRAKAIVLAMGCRERTRANLRIPGTRPAGVYTAGTAQRLINRQNAMVGRRVVILGSGDIGMIMARRMTLEGAKIEAVVEIMDYLAGLTRNRVQCLDDFSIPLLLSHTVTKITGERRVEGVTIAQVDKNKQPVSSTERYIPCDTLLLSVGLIPENELSRAAGIRIDPLTNGPAVNQFMQSARPEVFACGNVVHVNDLADNVSMESETAGAYAALYAAGNMPPVIGRCHCAAGRNVRYICPQHLAITQGECPIRLYFRVASPGGASRLNAYAGKTLLTSKKVLCVNPGEMVYLDFDAQGLAGHEIRIDVEEA